MKCSTEDGHESTAPLKPASRGGPWKTTVATAFACGLIIGLLIPAGCVRARRPLNTGLIQEAWTVIQREYVDQKAVQPTPVTYGAINGMVDSLADTGHSTFLTPQMVSRLKDLERGELQGIGVEIQRKGGQVVIVSPLDGSPAKRAGLKAGDAILKVNGEDASNWSLSQVADKVTGRPGTIVRLTVLDPRTGARREVAVTREAIKLHEVTWQLLPGTRIAHIRIASFDAGVSKDFRAALVQIQAKGVRGLILDLRDNPGGLLGEGVAVASQFLKGGNVLLVKDGRGAVSPVAAQKGGVAQDLPIIVLVNRGTASAAEIVAGALRDAHRATLLGETTFGTGTVLRSFKLSDGSALLLAVEEWLTPNGESFWRKGIAPQETVSLPPSDTPLFPATERGMTQKEIQASNDQQLLRAIALLNHSETAPRP